ncbi:MAG: nucleotidyltransferase substrate binding protein [Bacteriovoracales bacterium]|nr:nucleotidyltransferase substrate binding protein [Bacteriovoracales bacterium]
MKKDKMPLDTTFLKRCIESLEGSFTRLGQAKKDDILYDIFRAATIKEFEIILEQSGKLLRKCLGPYFHSPKEVAQMTFKDVFRHSGRHGLISLKEVERWLEYRDNRNLTSHDYGFKLAEQTLRLIPSFIKDAQRLVSVIESAHDS